MKNFKNVVDEIYEFIDELIGSIIPGLYFLSYAIFIILTFIFICTDDKSNGFMNGSEFVMIFVFVVSYVLGTMFRRSNSREPDSRSARYVYYKSTPIDDNDFAFAELITDNEYEALISSFKSLIDNDAVHIKFNKKLLNSREYKGPLSKRFINRFRKL